MQNFDYMTPTRLVFGENVVENLPEVMAAIGKRVLLTYGGGSIKTPPILTLLPVKMELNLEAVRPALSTMHISARSSSTDTYGGVQ